MEAALQAVAEQEAKLAWFDQDEPTRPTPAEQAELQRLGSDLEAVWYAADADHRLQQQIVRELIQHVLADVDEATDESVLWLHWTGGHHTEFAPRVVVAVAGNVNGTSRKCSTRYARSPTTRRSAARLNRAGILTERGRAGHGTGSPAIVTPWDCGLQCRGEVGFRLAFAGGSRYQIRNQSDEPESSDSARNFTFRRRIPTSASNPTSRSEPKGGNSGGQAHQIAWKLPATRKPQTTISIPVKDLRKRCIMNRTRETSATGMQE